MEYADAAWQVVTVGEVDIAITTAHPEGDFIINLYLFGRLLRMLRWMSLRSCGCRLLLVTCPLLG